MLVAAVHMPGSADNTANRKYLVDAVSRAASLGAQVVTFPEYANGYQPKPDPAIAESLGGETVMQLATAAIDLGVLVVTGFLGSIPESDKALNVTLFLTPDGRAKLVPKLHLFDALGGSESDAIMRVPADTEPKTVEFGELTWGALTCYDLRFPEVARKNIDAGVQVIIVPAAWLGGEGKQYQWETLLAARAIENVSYVIGVGLDAEGLDGGIRAFDPWGNPIGEQSPTESDIWLIEVSPEVVSDARVRNPSLDLRRFTVIPNKLP